MRNNIPLFFAVILFLGIVVSLIRGKVTRRYSTPVYRDDDPSLFRNYVIIYAIVDICCLLFGIKIWMNQNYFDPPEYIYYDVSVAPQQSLESALISASPIHPGAKIAYGMTTWNVRWEARWSTDKSQKSCSIWAANAYIQSEIQLPHLRNGSDAQKKQFDNYVEGLRAHQLVHYGFGLSAAKEIEKEVNAMPAMADCGVLEMAVNALAKKIINDYRTRGQAYDLSNEFLNSQHALLEY